MKIKRFCCIASLCLFIFPGFVIGCAGTSAPSRFYTLRSLGDQKPAQIVPSAAQSVSVGIGPVVIPDYLDRPQIVVRTGQNELHLSEYDRWAGSLQDDIARVLAEDISVLLSGDQVAVFSRRWDLSMDYTVEIDITRFDIMPGNNVSLKAQWSIFDREGRSAIAIRESVVSEPISDGDYSGKVAAMSQALERLSADIAEAIRPLIKSTKK